MKQLIFLILIIIFSYESVFADRPWPDSDYENPIFFGDQFFGKNGSQWKPRKRHVKIKLTAGVTDDFDFGCYVETIDDQREYLDYIKTDSRGRRVYKTSFPCELYQSNKVTCEEDKQTVVFRSKRNRKVCTRIK